MNIKGRNIWILGGTGFIGTSLVRQLANNPQNRLNLLVHKHIPYQSLESFNTFNGNLENFNYEWMKRFPPEIIFHLARFGGSNRLTRHISSIRGENANRKLISFLSGLQTPPKIIYVSGSLMYGNQSMMTNASERSALAPVSFAKYYIRGEKPLLESQRKKQFDIRFARPGWIIGPSSWFTTFYWSHYIKTGKVPVYGNGEQLMSLVHVDDCAGQILNLAENGEAMQNANIFTGMPVSQQFFSETLALLLKTGTAPVPIAMLQKQFGNTVSQAFEASIPLTTEYPGLMGKYRPLHSSVEEMLSYTISFLKHN